MAENDRPDAPDAAAAPYTRFADVPWFRRSVVNLLAAVAGLVFPPLLWAVCLVLFTGPVYSARTDESGNLKTWGDAARWVVLIIALLQAYRWIRDAM